ncbi:hypothetical protein IM40_01040 [Candidatus Paracaedimonas acanthamoebae]|nr:hypothetical protein IM40_01040 [Candidatus Paracaedimonas acanthamoebae]
MGFRLFYSFIVSFSFLFTLNFSCASENEQDPKVTLRVHAVGQGNCVSLEVRRPNIENSEFMLVDIGSTSFVGEAAYRRFQANAAAKIQAATDFPMGLLTPPKATTRVEIPFSTAKSPDWSEAQEDTEVLAELKGTAVESFVEEMRKIMKPNKGIQQTKKVQKEEIKPISVKTVVITHPDKDHYGWLMNLFHHKEDTIEFLIFGGLPSHYYSQPREQEEFNKWLNNRLKTHSKIFFPAIQYEPLALQTLENLLQEILIKEREGKFAPHTFSGALSFTNLALAKAFDFDERVIISLLTLNPLHIGDLGNVVRLADDDADDNKDSLVLRVQYGASSVMLTGDATQATTRRIKQNYKDDINFLKSTVLLASHHGSAEHGCNSEEWVKLVEPQYVLISHGHKYGHPQAQAYENFKKSPHLKTVKFHHVLVGKGLSKDDIHYEGSLHTTSRAIYSTLNSGALTLELCLQR